MALSVNISILGDKALDAKLGKLENAMQKKIVRSALRAAAKPVLAAMKAYVPVVTGDLRDSLKIQSIKRSRKYIGVNITSRPKPGKRFYAAFVELGGPKRAANPFMRKPFWSHKTGSFNIIAQETASGILEAAR